MIELGFMRLYLSEIPVIEVPGVFNWPTMLKDNYSSSSVAHCKIVACSIKSHRSKCVLLSDGVRLSLAEPINVDPRRKLFPLVIYSGPFPAYRHTVDAISVRVCFHATFLLDHLIILKLLHSIIILLFK